MHIEKSSILPYSTEQMYSVVTDIEAYPTFLDWCTSTAVEHSESTLDDTHISVASLDIAFKRLSLAFTTRNVNRLNDSVEMQLVTGPFSHLEGRWNFAPLSDDASKVSLSMQFEFESILTRKLIGSVFEQLVGSQINAFEKRAKNLYDVD